MPDLTPQSPLMSVVDYDGQMYYTSQYFHRQYVANSDAGKGKYRQHQTFVRRLKSIEAYQLYLDHGDIVELLWSKGGEITGTKSVPVNNINTLEPLFRSVSYNPIILLNATAQAALSQYLDDELSKQMSVTINTQAAHGGAPLSLKPPTQGQVALALAQAVVALEERQDRLERQHEEEVAERKLLTAKIAAIDARQPPEGKLRITDWLKRYGKPQLPDAVFAHLRSLCRTQEDPELFRPDWADHPLPYYSPYTITAAYEQATRQLSFFSREASHGSRKERR
jgi:hypothetical protein